MKETRGIDKKAPGAPQMFGNAGVEHMEKYGTTELHFAKIGAKNHKHRFPPKRKKKKEEERESWSNILIISPSFSFHPSTLNPYSQFQEEYTVDQVHNARKVFKYLTLLQCCPTSDGSGCAILASEEFVKKHNLQGLAVEIAAQHMATDSPKAFSGSSIELVGFDMTKRAVEKCIFPFLAFLAFLLFSPPSPPAFPNTFPWRLQGCGYRTRRGPGSWTSWLLFSQRGINHLTRLIHLFFLSTSLTPFPPPSTSSSPMKPLDSAQSARQENSSTQATTLTEGNTWWTHQGGWSLRATLWAPPASPSAASLSGRPAAGVVRGRSPMSVMLFSIMLVWVGLWLLLFIRKASPRFLPLSFLFLYLFSVSLYLRCLLNSALN